MADAADISLVPGRTCGACDVCCTALTIDDPEFQKPHGLSCKHLRAEHGCGIYESRPGLCRTWFCGWRRLGWVRAGLRPDLSGVLTGIMPVPDETGAPTQAVGLFIGLLTRNALRAEGLAETAAAAVRAGIPLFLRVPGPPGYSTSQIALNQALAGPVAARDKAAVLRVLQDARAQALRGQFVPLRMKHGTGPDGYWIDPADRDRLPR